MKTTLKSIIGFGAISAFLLSACTPVVYEQRTVVAPPPPPTQQVYVVPAWAPAYTYSQQVQYYFLPDLDVYYNVYNQQFVYFDGYNWQFAQTLPQQYGFYDLNSSYIVYLDYHANNPWLNNEVYCQHYPRYYYTSQYTEYNGQPVRGYNENERKPFYAPHGSYNYGNSSTGNSGVVRGNTINNEGNYRIYYPHQNTGNSGVGAQQQQRDHGVGNSGVVTNPNENRVGNSGVNTNPQQNYGNPGTGNSGISTEPRNQGTGNSGINTNPQPQNYNAPQQNNTPNRQYEQQNNGGGNPNYNAPARNENNSNQVIHKDEPVNNTAPTQPATAPGKAAPLVSPNGSKTGVNNNQTPTPATGQTGKTVEVKNKNGKTTAPATKPTKKIINNKTTPKREDTSKTEEPVKK